MKEFISLKHLEPISVELEFLIKTKGECFYVSDSEGNLVIECFVYEDRILINEIAKITEKL